jgi:hypothetical protein
LLPEPDEMASPASEPINVLNGDVVIEAPAALPMQVLFAPLIDVGPLDPSTNDVALIAAATSIRERVVVGCQLEPFHVMIELVEVLQMIEPVPSAGDGELAPVATAKLIKWWGSKAFIYSLIQ